MGERRFESKVKDGVPTPADVLAAIDDLESLYQACQQSGRLAEETFDFMKQPLKLDDMVDITQKLTYQPPAVQVLNFDQFPA